MSWRNSGSKGDHQDRHKTGRKDDDFVMVDERSLRGFDGEHAAADSPISCRSMWASIKSSLTYVQSKFSGASTRSMEQTEPEVTRSFSAPKSAQILQELQSAMMQYDDQPTESVVPPEKQGYFLGQSPEPRSRWPAGHPRVASSRARLSQPAFSYRSESRRGSGEAQLHTPLHPCLRPVTPEFHPHDQSNDPEGVKVKEFPPGTLSMAAHVNQQSGTNDNPSTAHDGNKENDDQELERWLSEDKLTQAGAAPGVDSSPPITLLWYAGKSSEDSDSMSFLGHMIARKLQNRGTPSDETADSADESDESESSCGSASASMEQDESLGSSPETKVVEPPPPSPCTSQGTSASDRTDAIAVEQAFQDSGLASDWSDNEDAPELPDSECESGCSELDTTTESVPVACDGAVACQNPGCKAAPTTANSKLGVGPTFQSTAKQPDEDASFIQLSAPGGRARKAVAEALSVAESLERETNQALLAKSATVEELLHTQGHSQDIAKENIASKPMDNSVSQASCSKSQTQGRETSSLRLRREGNVDITYRSSPPYPVSDSAYANATSIPGTSSRKSQLSNDGAHNKVMSDRRQGCAKVSHRLNDRDKVDKVRQRTLPSIQYRQSAEHDPAGDTSHPVIYKPPFPLRERPQGPYYQDARQQQVKKTAQAATGDAAKSSNFPGRTGSASAISPNTAAVSNVFEQPHGSHQIGAISHTMNASSSNADQLSFRKRSTVPGFPATPARRSPLPSDVGKEFWSKLLGVSASHELLTQSVLLSKGHILVPPIFRLGAPFHCKCNGLDRFTTDPDAFFQTVRSELKLKRLLANPICFAAPRQSRPNKPETVTICSSMIFLTGKGSHAKYECVLDFRTADGYEPGGGHWLIAGVFLKNLAVDDRPYHRL